MIYFLIGVILGACLGFVMFALMFASKKSKEDSE